MKVLKARLYDLEVPRRLSSERREKIPGVASDAPNARHRLQVAGIDGDTHRS